MSYIQDSIKINDLHPKLYVEPFVGGASVAINLLHKNLVEKAILVDLDPWITSFWTTVFYDTDWLVDQILAIEVSLEKWIELKKGKPRTIRGQALTCLFLNRTSFSGILERKVGPIGGKEQKSDYKIDCRFTQTTKMSIINRIQQISAFKDRVYGVWNCSWNEAMLRIKTEQSMDLLPKSGLFYYLDPPFFEEAEALYRFYFREKDHKALRDHLLTLDDKWLLSYDPAAQVKRLYGDAIKNGTNGTRKHEIELLYTIAKISERKRGKEVIISNLDRLPTPQNGSSNGGEEE